MSGKNYEQFFAVLTPFYLLRGTTGCLGVAGLLVDHYRTKRREFVKSFVRASLSDGSTRTVHILNALPLWDEVIDHETNSRDFSLYMMALIHMEYTLNINTIYNEVKQIAFTNAFDALLIQVEKEYVPFSAMSELFSQDSNVFSTLKVIHGELSWRKGWLGHQKESTTGMIKRINYLVNLISGFSLLYFLPLYFRMLWQPDETRYAEISREMLASEDWIVPHLFGLRYFEKPVMGYWINNIGQWVFGDSNFAVRLGSVFSITLSASLVAWFAWSQWKNWRQTILSAVIYLTFLLVYGVGTYAVLDTMVTLWLTAAMCAFWKTTLTQTVRAKVCWYLTLGVVCGMGVMTKGFIAWAVPVVAIIPWIYLTRNRKQLAIYVWLAVFSAMLITLPWAIAIALREPDFWNYFFWVEHIQRLADSNAAQHKAPFWYYIPVIILGTLPWLGLLPAALHYAWKNKANEPALFYLLAWVVMPLIFSITKGKLLTYILPCFAPLALLMSYGALHLPAVNSKIFKANAWINIAICVLSILALFFTSVMSRPLYSPAESAAFYFALIAFAFWSTGDLIALWSDKNRWALSALCPLGVALLIGDAVPQQIINSKEPQQFVEIMRDPLSPSRYILSNNPRVAAGLAWELKRIDIYFFAHKNEMDYYLGYADSLYKYISESDFDEWLRLHRAEGHVSLVLLADRHDKDIMMNLPEPDYVYRGGRFILLEYNQRP